MADKRNIKVKIAYRGTAYHGFQRQENSVAVQNVVEGVLSRLTAAQVSVNGCSRTDTGVHANEYCFPMIFPCWTVRKLPLIFMHVIPVQARNISIRY